MAQAEEASIVALLSRRIRLNDSISNLAARYRSARPFPHIFLDDVFDAPMLDRLVDEMPPLTADKFFYCEDDHLRQYGQRSAVDLGETGYQMVAFLHSAAFLYFLSEITGIWELLPDPYLQGGGYHVLPRKGAFDVHADRNMAYETGLLRRLSLIVYLNKEWRHEYGGQLELWNSDGSRREVVIEPLFNRTVIFEIKEQNFHGVPQRVTCPQGRSRNSFVVYYHTAMRGEDIVPHSSIYAPSFYHADAGGSRSRMIRMAKALCPPIVARAARRALRRK